MGVTLASRLRHDTRSTAVCASCWDQIVRGGKNQSDWRTKCRLKNVHCGRVLAQSNDGLGIILKFVLEFAIEDWRPKCRLKNADYGRVLAQSDDGLGIILEFY